MVGVQRDLSTVAEEEEMGAANVPVAAVEAPDTKRKGQKGAEPKPELKLRPGYMYREANWEIGRAAERAKVKVRAFKPGDRFAAWRKTVARRAKNAERRGLRRK